MYTPAARVQTRDALGVRARTERRSLRQVLVALCLLSIGCASPAVVSTPEPSVVLEYASGEAGGTQSTLNLVPNEQRISAVSQLADGTRLTEKVRFDGSGRVLEGTLSLVSPIAKQSREVVLDAPGGLVEVKTPSFHIYWQVPNDLPWIWSSLLNDPMSGAPIATPLQAIVVQRGAASSDALRWLDINAYKSHSIMVDQLLIPDERTPTVVLGDDWADLNEGIPARMHLAGPDTHLEGKDPQLVSATLACDLTPRGKLRPRNC